MHKARVVNIEWTPDNNRWNLDKQVFSDLKLKWIFKEQWLEVHPSMMLTEMRHLRKCIEEK